MRSRIRTHYEIRFEDYKKEQNLSKTQESSKILTHRAVVAVFTFLIKLILPRVSESLAANQERREFKWIRVELCGVRVVSSGAHSPPNDKSGRRAHPRLRRHGDHGMRCHRHLHHLRRREKRAKDQRPRQGGPTPSTLR